MLRPADTILLAFGRYGGWARGWMVYRALAVLAGSGKPAVRR